MNKELKKLLENAGMHEVEINEDYNEAGIDKLEQKIMIMITRFARSIKTLKSNAYDVYGLDDPEEVNSIIEQMIYEFLDDKLSENIIEANPDGSISQGEDDEFLGLAGRQRWLAHAKERGYRIKNIGDEYRAYDDVDGYNIGSHLRDDSNPKNEYWGYFDDELSENIIETNPDGSISQGEGERRANFLDMFEFALDELLGKAMAEAHEIGGQFRSPGIKAQIRKMLAFKARSL